MERGSAPRTAFRALLERFPGRSQTICSVALRDRRFRAMLEDLRLAIETLERFERRPDAALRPEIPEYRILIAEIESEVAGYLDAIERG